MKNSESLQPEEDLQDQQLEGSESVEVNGLEKEIQEAQAELNEGVEELNGHIAELQELENDGGLFDKEKNVLKNGLQEIKDFIQANPMLNLLAGMELTASVSRDVSEGKDVKEIISNVLSQVITVGIVKAVAYLGWGKKAQEKARAAEEKEEKRYDEEESNLVEERTEVLPADENVEAEISQLKGELDEIYDREKE